MPRLYEGLSISSLTRIRTATIKDLDVLLRLEEAFFPGDAFNRAQLRYLVTKANATTLVVEQDGQVIGAATVLWRLNSQVSRLYSMATAPEFQRRGFGSRLLKACEEEARRCGRTRMSLEVRADNSGAIAFYHRHGYSRAEGTGGFYADGTAALRMRKDLSKAQSGAPRLSFLNLAGEPQTAIH